MKSPSLWRLGGVTLLVAAMAFHNAPAISTETTTYAYDVFGRLVTVASSGSVNNGVQTVYNHDAADNRTSVTVTGASGAPPPPPPPPPPPTGIVATNPSRTVTGSTSSTFAIADLATMNGRSGAIITFTPSAGSASIVGGGQSATFTAPAALSGGSNCDAGADRTVTISYSIRDSGNGATASGTVTVTVPGRPARGGGACQ